MKRFQIEQSDEEFYTSHSGIALVGLAVNRCTSLSSALACMNAPGDLIAGIDVIIRDKCREDPAVEVLILKQRNFLVGGDRVGNFVPSCDVWEDHVLRLDIAEHRASTVENRAVLKLLAGTSSRLPSFLSVNADSEFISWSDSL